jgi:hypothetical protein
MTIAVSSSNGEAPADALSTLPGRNGDGNPHTAPHVTAASYARIRAAMQAAGLGDLIPTDGWSCYRDLAAQQHMRDIGLTTIPVGQSIHGEWTHGSAVDFSNLGGFGAPRHNWLRDHGGAYGWYQPSWAGQWGSLPEPWHWEYDERNDQHTNDQEVIDVDLNNPADRQAMKVVIAETLRENIGDGATMGAPPAWWTTSEDLRMANTMRANLDDTLPSAAGGWAQASFTRYATRGADAAAGTATTQDAGSYRVAVLALVIALAVLAGLVVTARYDETSGVWVGSGILLGGLLVWALAEVTRRRGRHTA